MKQAENEEATGPYSTEIPELYKRHFDEISKGSGISIEVMKERGYKTILGKAELHKLGFTKCQRKTPGIHLPVWTVEGRNTLCQYKPDIPRQKKGKDIKYETPDDVGLRIDVPPRCRENLKNPNIKLWITEGIKKADALAAHGETVIDLLGVWGFKHKNEFKAPAISTDLDYIAWKDRIVLIAYDSDVMTRPEIRRALEELTEILKRKGAKVSHVYLPSQDNNKVGVDDYLLTHSIDDLLTLAREPQALKEVEAQKQNTRPAAFLFNGDWLVELIRDGEDTAYIIFNTKTGEVQKRPGVQLEDGTILVPPEKGLILSNIVWLASGVEAYGKEDALFLKVREFIYTYVELGEFLDIASLYVLLSWLYDRFTELPYLRFMGDYGTGKSRALTVIGSICYKPFFTFGASTISPIFRLLDAFRGTMILDEADHKDSGLWNDLIKILNTGFQANIPLLRTEGDRKKEVKAFHVFGPKLIATRRPFYDDALESRCLTKIMSPGARRKEIPINLPTNFSQEAESLRNQLLFFRLQNYLSTAIDETAYMPRLEDRLNQVLLPLFSIAQGEFREILTEFSGKLQEKILEARSQSLEGLTVKVLLELQGTEEPITAKLVAAKLDELGVKEITARRAGSLIRGLGFEAKRNTTIRSRPYTVTLESERLDTLAKRYGVENDEDEF